MPFPYSGSRRGSLESGSSTRACICHRLGLPRTPDMRRSPGEREGREEQVRICIRVAERGACSSGKANGCFLAAMKEGLVPKREKKMGSRKNDLQGWWDPWILTGASEGSAVTSPAGLQEPTAKERHEGGFMKRQLSPGCS